MAEKKIAYQLAVRGILGNKSSGDARVILAHPSVTHPNLCPEIVA
jgi:hypothetical protein